MGRGGIPGHTLQERIFESQYFEMPIWHPTCEKSLDEWLDAKVDL
jgi:hypothetical protein